MTKEKVLIVVKTYPVLSNTYGELVCTAGFREDGSWVRLYPVRFRTLESYQKYKKYQWIEVELVRREKKDFRPESFSPVNVDAIQVLGEIKPDGDSWIERREICLKSKVWTNLTDLILEAKDPQKYTSLATFKPTKLLDFIIEPVTREWDEKKVQNIFESEKQMKMFAENTLSDHFKIVEKIPYKFSYRFEDEAGKRSKLMIEDWETCQLYRKMVLKYKDETIACQKVRERYWDDFALKKDLHFFLGTTLAYHKKNLKYPADNPFIIIGTFYPKPILNNPQTALF